MEFSKKLGKINGLQSVNHEPSNKSSMTGETEQLHGNFNEASNMSSSLKEFDNSDIQISTYKKVLRSGFIWSAQRPKRHRQASPSGSLKAHRDH